MGGKGSFKSDPPNAGLTSIVDGKLQTATVELTKPYLNGATLTYAVRVLGGTPPASDGTSSLFIDSCPCCVNPHCAGGG